MSELSLGPARRVDLAQMRLRGALAGVMSDRRFEVWWRDSCSELEGYSPVEVITDWALGERVDGFHAVMNLAVSLWNE